MGRLISWYRRVVCRRRPVGDEIYDAALNLARRQRSLRELSHADVLPGEWL
jgi:hypothetical protein